MMLLQNLSFIGWIHTLASVVSLFAGGMALVLPKGSATHQRQGQIYVVAMVLTNLTALCIYSHGTIIFAHWLAMAALVFVLGGYVAVHWKAPHRAWLNLHLSGMILSYYLLIGGAVNEAFLRIPLLRPMVKKLGLTQSVVMVVFIVLLTYWLRLARRHLARANVSV